MTGRQDRFPQDQEADGSHPLLNSYIHKQRVKTGGDPNRDGGVATSAYADQAASAGHAATARRMVENAHGSKVRATEAWVNGDMSSQQHAEVHSRANRVIKAKGALALRTDAKGSASKAKGSNVAGGFKGARPSTPRAPATKAARRTNAAGRAQQGPL
jgi:hypothetical protein